MKQKETKEQEALRRIIHIANSKSFYRQGKLALMTSMAREALKK